MSEPRIARVLTCEDKRLHRPDARMYEQLCALLEVDDCYIGTEAGPDGAVLHDGVRFPAIEKNASIIGGAVAPTVWALVAHYDCAGHHVADAQHDADVVSAARKLTLASGNPASQVVPVIAYQNPDNSGSTWLFKRLDS